MGVNDKINLDSIIKSYEELIKKVTEAKSVSIKINSDGKISEIRVVSDSKKSPKELVRDLEATLIGFSMGKNHCVTKIIDNTFDTESRLKIDEITTKTVSFDYKVIVELSDDKGNKFEGWCTYTDSEDGYIRAIANAAIDSLQQLIKNKYSFSVEDISIYKIGDSQAVSVLLNFKDGENKEQLIGSAIFEDEKGKANAVVKAILKAVNKKISDLY